MNTIEKTSYERSKLALVLCAAGAAFLVSIGKAHSFNPQPDPPKEAVSEQSASQPAAAAGRFEQNILLVIPAPGATSEAIKESLDKLKAQIVREVGRNFRSRLRISMLKVKVEPGKVDDVEKALKKDKNFAAVQKNFLLRTQGSNTPGAAQTGQPRTLDINAAFVPDDPYWPQSWHHGTIHTLAAWKKTGVMGGKGETVAVIDTGCVEPPAELTKLQGYDAFLNLPKCDVDPKGHGTEVAHVIGALVNNHSGVVGVSPNAKIFPIRACDKSYDVSVERIAEALDVCIQNNIRIVNLSVNAPTTSDSKYIEVAEHHPALHGLFQLCSNSGMLIFLSSAYPNQNCPTWAKYPYLIVVKGLPRSGKPYTKSQYLTSAVWFFAPGEDIPTRTTDGTVKLVDGSSYATAILSGIASLVWGANPNLSNGQVAHILKMTSKIPQSLMNAVPEQEYWGYGVPDAGKAVQMALDTK